MKNSNLPAALFTITPISPAVKISAVGKGEKAPFLHRISTMKSSLIKEFLRSTLPMQNSLRSGGKSLPTAAGGISWEPMTGADVNTTAPCTGFSAVFSEKRFKAGIPLYCIPEKLYAVKFREDRPPGSCSGRS